MRKCCNSKVYFWSLADMAEKLIRPIHAAFHTSPMKPYEDQFIPQALRVINDAVVGVIGLTNIHVRQTPLSKRLASRASARLRALEQMLRRVITLMALALIGQVHSTPKMLARIRVIGGATPIKPEPPQRRKTAKAPVPSLPPCRGGQCGKTDFTALPNGRPSAPIPIEKLIARIIRLQRVLANPAPSARRLALYYSRLKRIAAAPKPPPDIPLRRAPAELALIAGALPMEIARALAVWHNTS